MKIGEDASRVSLIEFNFKAKVLIDLSKGISKDILYNVVDNIRYRGGYLI